MKRFELTEYVKRLSTQDKANMLANETNINNDVVNEIRRQNKEKKIEKTINLGTIKLVGGRNPEEFDIKIKVLLEQKYKEPVRIDELVNHWFDNTRQTPYKAEKLANMKHQHQMTMNNDLTGSNLAFNNWEEIYNKEKALEEEQIKVKKVELLFQQLDQELFMVTEPEETPEEPMRIVKRKQLEKKDFNTFEESPPKRRKNKPFERHINLLEILEEEESYEDMGLPKEKSDAEVEEYLRKHNPEYFQDDNDFFNF